MKAPTVVPGTTDSARPDDFDELPEADGPVLVQTPAVGICGADIETLSGAPGGALDRPPDDVEVVIEAARA